MTGSDEGFVLFQTVTFGIEFRIPGVIVLDKCLHERSQLIVETFHLFGKDSIDHANRFRLLHTQRKGFVEQLLRQCFAHSLGRV